MRRYDRFKVIEQLNNKLNKKRNSIVENRFPNNDTVGELPPENPVNEKSTLVENKKQNKLNVLNESTNTMFQKLCGVKIIKESNDNKLSPEEAKHILGVITPLIKNYTPDNDNNSNVGIHVSLETYGVTESPMGLLFEIEILDGKDTSYAVEIGFGAKITHMEPYDPGDRWTPQGGGDVEFEAWPTKTVYLVDGTPTIDENGEVRYRNAEIKIEDAELAKLLFNEDAIYNVDNVREGVEEFLMKNIDDGGFREPDDYSASSQADVDGYNFAGGDWKPSRDNPFNS